MQTWLRLVVGAAAAAARKPPVARRLAACRGFKQAKYSAAWLASAAFLRNIPDKELNTSARGVGTRVAARRAAGSRLPRKGSIGQEGSRRRRGRRAARRRPARCGPRGRSVTTAGGHGCHGRARSARRGRGATAARRAARRRGPTPDPPSQVAPDEARHDDGGRVVPPAGPRQDDVQDAGLVGLLRRAPQLVRKTAPRRRPGREPTVCLRDACSWYAADRASS